MAAFLEFDADDVAGQQVTAGYTEKLRRAGFSLGIYRLPVGEEDHQHPHDADEVYIVQRGSATLQVEDEDLQVRAGSVVSVDRHTEHRFKNISEDLTVLVVFAPPETPET